MNYLGIDIGGTNIEIGIVDSENNISYKSAFKTADFESIEACCEAIYNDLAENKFTTFKGIGIGAPSVNFHSQNIEFAPNLTWGDHVQITTVFKNKFNCPVKAINDANAAAVGEWVAGGGKDLDNFAMITLGTGVGIGLVMGNEIFHGANGTGGEFGHICIQRNNGRECGCGNYGCLEAYIGKEGIISTAKQKTEFSIAPSKLHDFAPSKITAKDIFKFARKEDPVAVDIVDSIIVDLAFGISIICNALDLNNIFLFGGIAKEGNFLRKKTLKELKPLLTNALKESINLQISELVNDNPAIIGAVHVVKKSI
jgi:glucokinase